MSDRVRVQTVRITARVKGQRPPVPIIDVTVEMPEDALYGMYRGDAVRDFVDSVVRDRLVIKHEVLKDEVREC